MLVKYLSLSKLDQSSYDGRQTGFGKDVHLSAIDAADHSITVELDFVEQLSPSGHRHVPQNVR